MMGVPYFFLELLCVQVCTMCLCSHGRDPNSTMSLLTCRTPPLPPSTPLLPPLNANTHAGILLSLALLNLMHLQNANVDNLLDGCFALLPEMDTFGNGKILEEGGIADQANSTPLFQMGLTMTSLPAEVDSTAEGTVLEGSERGSIFPTSLSSTQRAHKSHITSSKYIYFLF
jgi:hypothetical protein